MSVVTTAVGSALARLAPGSGETAVGDVDVRGRGEHIVLEMEEETGAVRGEDDAEETWEEATEATGEEDAAAQTPLRLPEVVDPGWTGEVSPYLRIPIYRFTPVELALPVIVDPELQAGIDRERRDALNEPHQVLLLPRERAALLRGEEMYVPFNNNVSENMFFSGSQGTTWLKFNFLRHMPKHRGKSPPRSLHF